MIGALVEYAKGIKNGSNKNLVISELFYEKISTKNVFLSLIMTWASY